MIQKYSRPLPQGEGAWSFYASLNSFTRSFAGMTIEA